jgi:RimJ/RimL family protein N-acetyltransferase
VQLRPVRPSDLDVLFEFQRDPEANRMAAFAAADPNDREAYVAKWTRILAESSLPTRAIVVDGEIVGSVFCWRDEALGIPEVSYWIGKDHWGKGIATQALALLLDEVTERPLRARAARDNVASLRVLEKCGFRVVGEDRGFANARGEEVDELVLELRAKPEGP